MSNYHQIPDAIIDKCGPFDEFKQDTSLVRITIKDKTVYDPVLVLYPNYIIGVFGSDELPFDTEDIIHIANSNVDRSEYLGKNWRGKLYKHPWSR